MKLARVLYHNSFHMLCNLSATTQTTKLHVNRDPGKAVHVGGRLMLRFHLGRRCSSRTRNVSADPLKLHSPIAAATGIDLW